MMYSSHASSIANLAGLRNETRTAPDDESNGKGLLDGSLDPWCDAKVRGVVRDGQQPGRKTEADLPSLGAGQKLGTRFAAAAPLTSLDSVD
jgi:hypothetical protein